MQNRRQLNLFGARYGLCCWNRHTVLALLGVVLLVVGGVLVMMDSHTAALLMHSLALLSIAGSALP